MPSPGDDVHLPIPVAIVVRHIDAITRQGSDLLLDGRVADAEAATALALYDALSHEPELPLVKEYLAGRLDNEYPGASGVELWATLVSTVDRLATDKATLITTSAPVSPPAGAQPSAPRLGQMIMHAGPVVPVAHPALIIRKPPLDRFDHPNAVLFAGDLGTALALVKQAMKRNGLVAIASANALTVATTRARALRAPTRAIVRFTSITFNDAQNTAGTAILLHGLDTELLERIRSVIRAAGS